MATTIRGIRRLALALFLQALATSTRPAAGDGLPFDWQTLVAETRGGSPVDTARRINRHVNHLKHVSDMANWQQEDFWATPMELFLRGAGDCEDFAIAKYFLLRAQGVRDERLQLLVARLHNPETQRIEPHMVLLHRLPGESQPRVLDNIRNDMLPLSDRRDLLPVAAFDQWHVWAYDDGRDHARSVSGHNRWSALLERWHWQKARWLVAEKNPP